MTLIIAAENNSQTLGLFVLTTKIVTIFYVEVINKTIPLHCM